MSFLLIFNKMMKEITMTIDGPAAFTERFINQTSQHLFLTGKAGTGKTTLLNALSDRLKIDRRNKLSGSRQINDCIPLTQESFGRYGAYVM